jgi:hypothetical protein
VLANAPNCFFLHRFEPPVRSQRFSHISNAITL